MLKRLALLALLAAYLLGRPCVAKNQQPKSDTTHKKTGSDNQPAATKYDIVDPPLPSPPSQSESQPAQQQPIEKPLPRFERPEWVIVYITAVYAFISWLTLRAMKRQANLMKRQADLMSLQNEMILSKERGRLYVELEEFTGIPIDVFGFPVSGSISIFGPTDVAVDAAELWAVIDDPQSPSIPPFTYRSIGVPKVIRANSSPTKVMTSVMHNDFLQAEAIGEVLSGEKMVYCRGAIIFTNLFDRKYIFKISKRFRLIFPGQETAEGKPEMFGIWENYGGPEENGEYQLFETRPTPQRNGLSWIWPFPKA